MDAQKSVYIMLGSRGAGRREVLLDLVSNGFDSEERIRLYRTDEFQESDFADFPPNVEIMPWGVSGGSLSIESPESAPENIFILTNGRESQIDQMEILVALLRRLNWSVARVLTVIDCALLEKTPALAEWYKACLHFSDTALLNRRETVPNSWMKAFTDGYKEACNPCVFEFVKKGKLDNPSRVLLPEARRLSMVFDDTDPLDEMEFDEDNLPDEPFDLVSKADPYFERNDAGARCIRLPDIKKFVP